MENPFGKTNGAAPIDASNSPLNTTELPLNSQPPNPPNPQAATEVNTTQAIDFTPTLAVADLTNIRSNDCTGVLKRPSTSLRVPMTQVR